MTNEEELDLEGELWQLSSKNSVHDRTQFETKFDFELNPGLHKKLYDVDLYLFIPKSLGVNSDSYPLQSFYADLTHLLRVRTPLLEPKSGQPTAMPHLSSLEEYFQSHLDTRRRQELMQLVVHDIKLFGCMIYSEMKRLRQSISRFVKRSDDHGRLLRRLEPRLALSLEQLHREIRNYRERYVWRVKEEPLLVDDEVKRALWLIDEYLSYRLEEGMVDMHRLLKPYAPLLEDLTHQVEALLTGEYAYRSEQLPMARDPEARVERHYYRLGLLKKYVSEVLFLQTERIKNDFVYRNFIAAFGAGLAALFATLAQIQTVKMVATPDPNDVGARLFLLVALGIVAYIFKDRIKDLVKDYFNSRLKGWLPDYHVKMFYTHFDSKGLQVQTYLGNSQEFTRYLKRPKVPVDIAYIRELGHLVEMEPERMESVLHYCKRMRFELREVLTDHLGEAQIKRVHDVLRVDISRFLAKLDDPKKKLSFYTPDQGIVTVEAPKVYHLNLVFRYTVSREGPGKAAPYRIEYERVRVVLNKKGIVRIETVLPRGELGLSA